MVGDQVIEYFCDSDTDKVVLARGCLVQGSRLQRYTDVSLNSPHSVYSKLLMAPSGRR